MSEEKVTWTVSEADKVSISDSGLLTVSEEAEAGSKITVTASSVTNPQVSGTMDITVLVKKMVHEKKLIADLKLDGTEDGYKGAGAVATLHGVEEGVTPEFPYEEIEGKSGLYFDKSRWLEVAGEDGSSLLKGLSEFTISYDSYTASSSVSNYIFFLTNTHEDGQATSANASEHPRFGILDYSGTLRVLNGKDGFNGKASADWKHIDVVYTEENVTVYVDGEQVSTAVSYEGIARILGAGESYLWIGKGPFKPAELFDGYLADFKIYNYALTAEELEPQPEENTIASIEVSGEHNVTSVRQGDILQMSAVVKDQDGGVMSGEGVTWTVNEGSRASISESGLLSVSEDAAVGDKITVTAISETKPEIRGTKEITVTAKDSNENNENNENNNNNNGGDNNNNNTNIGSSGANIDNGNSNAAGSEVKKESSGSKAVLKKAVITVRKGKKKVSKVTVKKGKTVTLKVSVDSKAKLTLGKQKRKGKKIARVTLRKGKLKIKAKKKGKISLVLTSAKTAKYEKAKKTVKVTVK